MTDTTPTNDAGDNSANFTVNGALDRSATEPFEVGVVQWIRRPGDGGRTDLSSGFWFITPDETPGPMRIVGHADETVYLLEGRIRIEPEDGEPFELAAGSVASFNRGGAATWTVLEPPRAPSPTFTGRQRDFSQLTISSIKDDHDQRNPCIRRRGRNGNQPSYLARWRAGRSRASHIHHL